MADQVCGICLAGVSDQLDPAEALQCGHVFHVECIGNYMEATHTTKSRLRCPVCKRAASDVEDLDVAVSDVAVADVAMLEQPVSPWVAHRLESLAA